MLQTLAHCCGSSHPRLSNTCGHFREVFHTLPFWFDIHTSAVAGWGGVGTVVVSKI